MVHERFFLQRLRVSSFEELYALLLDRCVAHARAHRHTELRDRAIWEVFETARPSLVPYARDRLYRFRDLYDRGGELALA